MERKRKSTKTKSVTWNESQLAVTQLLNDTSALIDIFDELSMVLGPECTLNHPRNPVLETIDVPPSKLAPIVKESCASLERCLSLCKPKSNHLI